MVLDSFRKPRLPRHLLYFQFLQGRMTFSPHYSRQYEIMKNGYIGEKKFYETMLELLPENSLILYSLNLSYRDAAFQLDSILFLQNKLIHFEIKYYDNDYVLHDDNWYVARSKQEINNPLMQLRRASSFLRQVVKEIGWHGEVEGHLVFMHASFYLYGARYGDPILFFSQVNRRIRQIVANHGKPMVPEKQLAEALVARHEEVSRYEQPPAYDYDALWKGLNCGKCFKGRLLRVHERLFQCEQCHDHIENNAVLSYQIRQLLFLFPESRLSVGLVYEWCGEVISKRIIRSWLEKTYKRVGHGKSTYYIKKNV